MRILIAEDDAALGSFLKKGLEAEHYALDVVADGEQARAMGATMEYDLIVLDLSLPRLDGVSVLRQIRAEKPSVPILVLTARCRVEDRVECLDLGADDYTQKLRAGKVRVAACGPFLWARLRSGDQSRDLLFADSARPQLRFDPASRCF